MAPRRRGGEPRPQRPPGGTSLSSPPGVAGRAGGRPPVGRRPADAPTRLAPTHPQGRPRAPGTTPPKRGRPRGPSQPYLPPTHRLPAGQRPQEPHPRPRRSSPCGTAACRGRRARTARSACGPSAAAAAAPRRSRTPPWRPQATGQPRRPIHRPPPRLPCLPARLAPLPTRGGRLTPRRPLPWAAELAGCRARRRGRVPAATTGSVRAPGRAAHPRQLRAAPPPPRPAPAAEDRQSGARSAAGRRAAPQSALGPRTAPAVECGRGLPRRVTTGGKRGDLPLPPVPRAANRAPGAPGATGEPANAAATRLQPPRAAPPPWRRACEGRRWLCEEGGAAGRGGRPGLGRGRSGACRPGQLPAAEPPGTAGPPGGGASPAPSPAVRLGPPAAHGLPPRSRQRAEAARGAPRPRERAEAAVEGGRGRASSGHRGRVQGEAAGAAPHPHPALPLRGSGKLQWGYGCSYRPVGLLV